MKQQLSKSLLMHIENHTIMRHVIMTKKVE